MPDDLPPLPSLDDNADAPEPNPLAQPVTPPTEPTDPLLAQVRDSQRLQLAETLRQAQASNPDRAATIVKLAAATRLHPSTVQEIEGDAKASVAVQNADVDGLMRDHPELAAWLLDKTNASVAHDDLPGLRNLDVMVRQATAGKFDDPLGILPKGYQFDGQGGIKRVYSDGAFSDQVGDYQGLTKSLQDTQNRGEIDSVQAMERDQRVGALANPFAAGALAAFGGTITAGQALTGNDTAGAPLSDIAAASQEQHPGLLNDAARLGSGLVADVPLMFTGGPVAEAAKGLGLARSTIRALTPILGAKKAERVAEGTLVGASMSPMALKSGINSGQQNGAGFGAVDALINMAIPAAFGRVGVQRLLTPTIEEIGKGGMDAALPAASFLLRQSGLDATQNASIELATAIHEYATGADPNALDPGTLAKRLGLSAAAGGLMGALFNLPEAAHIKAARDSIAIHQATAEADALGNATDAAIASKTVQRSPDQAAALIKGIMDATGTDKGTVYAQGDEFRAHYQERGEDPAAAAKAMGVDDATYAAAMTTRGATLPIPMEGFLTHFREDDKPLLDHTGLRPDALTRAQAGVASEALRSSIERQVADQGKAAEPDQATKDAAAAIKESAAKVRDIMEAQLVAAGRGATEAKHGAMLWQRATTQLAERWNATAAKRGAEPLTPEGILQRYRVQVTGERATTPEEVARTLNQEARTVAPRNESLEYPDMLRQWRKANGDRKPDTSSKEWSKLVEDSARVDAKSGRVYFQPAYHGTGNTEPYDRLRYDKVGGAGGEGTQNEGWGLYVTKSRNAGTFYREQNRARLEGESGLTGKTPLITEKMRAFYKPGRIVDGYGGKDRVISFDEAPKGWGGGWQVTVVREGADSARYDQLATRLKESEKYLADHPDSSWTRENIRRDKSEMERLTRTHATPPDAKELDKFIAKDHPDLAAKEKATEGRLYHVDIPDDQHFLHWDENLSESPDQVQEAVDNIVRKNGSRDQIEQLERGLTGKEAYRLISKILGGDKQASDALRTEGVLGNKYEGDEAYGHDNYVIFQDVPIRSYEQPGDTGKRGQIQVGKDRSLSIELLKKANASTFLHETGHAYLEILSDLGSKADAPPEMKADLETIRKWLGADEGKPWTTDQHEQFARGFERYLMEGKAPSNALRGAFVAFARWLGKLYHDLTNLRVELSPDVRRVFDKLLASDQEIAEAGRDLKAEPFFTTQADSGMTPAEHSDYLRAIEESRVRASDALRGQLMSFERSAAVAEREAAESEVRDQVTAQVDARPDIQAITALQDGKLPADVEVPHGTKLKLDRKELVDRYGADALNGLPGPAEDGVEGANSGRRLYATEDGMSLDAAAVLFGYRDGDSLWQALLNAPDRQATIDIGVRQEMARRFPDPLTPADIRGEAQAAMADELANDVVSREVDALSRLAKVEPTPRELIKVAAQRTVENMRAYTLRPETYRAAAEKAALKQFARQQELREAKPENRADIAAEVLAIAKERLTNLEFYAATKRAQDASAAAEAWIKRRDTLDAREKMGKAGGWEFTVYDARGDVVKSFPSEREALNYTQENPGSTFDRTSGYLEQWDAIQEGFSLKRASNKALRRRESLRQWVARLESDGEPVSIPDTVLDDLGRKRWQELTVGEQRSVADSLKNVYQLATKKNTLMAAKRKRDLEAVATELAAGIAKHASGTVAARLGTTPREKAAEAVGGFLASHRRDSFLARAMDGYQNAGAAWEHFILPRNEAAAAKSKRLEQAAEVRAEALKAWDRSSGGARDQIPGTHLRLTREQRIGMALYWGNREGRQRVLADLARQDQPATEADARAVLASLDKTDWMLVKATWKQLDSYWHEIASLERRTVGIAPERVEALPFATAHGVMEGGYYPIKYDQTQGSKATNIDDATDAKSKLRAANLASSTRRGFTKQRAEQVQGRGLRYDFGTVAEHLSEVIHDLTHREMLQDQNRLFRNPTIADAMVKHYGKRALDQLVNTTADIAQGEAPAKSAAERFARKVRQGSSAALFGFNLTTALSNVTGVLQAIPRVGAGRLLQSLAHMGGDAVRMRNAMVEAESRSDFMATRARTYLREVAEANASTTVKGKLDAIQRFGYWPMSQTQRVIDALTWHAGHDLGLTEAGKRGLERKDAEELAGQIADQTVIDTQGSGRIGDMPAIMRGGEVSKFFTAFYGYFSTTYNLMAESAGRAVRKGEIGQLFGTLISVYALPAVLTDLIGQSLRGDSAPYDWKKLAQAEASYGLGMLVGFRELSGAVQGFSYSGPGSLGMINRAYQFSQQIGQGSADAGFLKAGVGLGLAPFGLPALESQRLIDAWLIAQEKGDYTAALRAALFGKPHKQ